MTGLLSLNRQVIPKAYRHGFDSFKLYSAMKLHVQGSYDGTKYCFKKPVAAKYNHDSFPDQFVFNRIAKEYTIEEQMIFFGRNLIDHGYVRDFSGDTGSKNFLEAKGFIEQSSTVFKDMFNSYLLLLHKRGIKFSESLTGQSPFIAKGFELGRVPAEFLLCLDAAFPFLEKSESLIYQDLFKKVSKYGRLFIINTQLTKEVIRSCVR